MSHLTHTPSHDEVEALRDEIDGLKVRLQRSEAKFHDARDKHEVALKKRDEHHKAELERQLERRDEDRKAELERHDEEHISELNDRDEKISVLEQRIDVLKLNVLKASRSGENQAGVTALKNQLAIKEVQLSDLKSQCEGDQRRLEKASLALTTGVEKVSQASQALSQGLEAVHGEEPPATPLSESPRSQDEGEYHAKGLPSGPASPPDAGPPLDVGPPDLGPPPPYRGEGEKLSEHSPEPKADKKSRPWYEPGDSSSDDGRLPPVPPGGLTFPNSGRTVAKPVPKSQASTGQPPIGLPASQHHPSASNTEASKKPNPFGAGVFAGSSEKKGKSETTCATAAVETPKNNLGGLFGHSGIKSSLMSASPQTMNKGRSETTYATAAVETPKIPMGGLFGDSGIKSSLMSATSSSKETHLPKRQRSVEMDQAHQLSLEGKRKKRLVSSPKGKKPSLQVSRL